MSSKRKNRIDPMEIYLKKSHEFAINQAIERVVFEYSMDCELFDCDLDLDLDLVYKYLTGIEVFEEKEYRKILVAAKKILKEKDLL